MLKNEKQLTGNNRYEGFTVDLLKELSERSGFEYEIYIVDKYGSPTEDGKWNGMVGEVLRGVKTSK